MKIYDPVSIMLVEAKDELKEGSSKETIQENIKTEIKAGKEPDQAAAIAYNKAKDADDADDASKQKEAKIKKLNSDLKKAKMRLSRGDFGDKGNKRLKDKIAYLENCIKKEQK